LKEKVENTAVGIIHADYVAPSIRKSYPTSGGGLDRSRTQATEFICTYMLTTVMAKLSEFFL
jgi:hypothetical protein